MPTHHHHIICKICSQSNRHVYAKFALPKLELYKWWGQTEVGMNVKCRCVVSWCIMVYQ